MRSTKRYSLLLIPFMQLLLGSAAALLAANNAWSLPSDRNQPIHVQADTLEADNNKVAVYRGNVIITQGSMVVKGDKVTITQAKSGDVDTVTAQGHPAYYEQKPNASSAPVKAWGMTIQYLVANQRLIILDQARLQQQGDTFRGEKVVYDLRRRIVNAGRAGKTKVSKPTPRIDMIIQPKNQQSR